MSPDNYNVLTNTHDMQDILPIELWSKIVSFLPGCDRALVNFFVVRGFDITEKQAKEIASRIVRSRFLKSKSLEEVFYYLNNPKVFESNLRARNLILKYVDNFLKKFKVEHNLAQSISGKPEDIKRIKGYLKKNFKQTKNYFKNKIGLDLQGSELVVNAAIKDSFDLRPKRLANVFFKIKNRKLVYKDFENFDLLRKKDFNQIRSVALFSLYITVFFLVCYFHFMSLRLPDIADIFKVFYFYSTAIFCITAPFFNKVDCQMLEAYEDMFLYLDRLEESLKMTEECVVDYSS